MFLLLFLTVSAVQDAPVDGSTTSDTKVSFFSSKIGIPDRLKGTLPGVAPFYRDDDLLKMMAQGKGDTEARHVMPREGCPESQYFSSVHGCVCQNMNQIIKDEKCIGCGSGKQPDSPTSCEICKAGYYQPSESGRCFLCPSMTFNPVPGASWCQSCPYLKADVLGSTDCPSSERERGSRAYSLKVNGDHLGVEHSEFFEPLGGSKVQQRLKDALEDSGDTLSTPLLPRQTCDVKDGCEIKPFITFNGKKVCQAGFERALDLSGCVPCKVGFSSRQDDVCYPCARGYFSASVGGLCRVCGFTSTHNEEDVTLRPLETGRSTCHCEKGYYSFQASNGKCKACWFNWIHGQCPADKGPGELTTDVLIEKSHIKSKNARSVHGSAGSTHPKEWADGR